MERVLQSSPVRKHIIGLVIPSFEDTGGVTTVAEFILRAIRRRPNFEVRIISLATSARDPCSLLLHDPRTWRRGATTRAVRCHGETFTHVGARFGEFEFQRLKPRRELTALLDECDLIQVVAGAPAWALPVLGLSRPVVLQVATLTTVERHMRQRLARGPKALWRRMMTGIVARFDERALRRVDAVLVENPWMQSYADAAATGGATRVVYAPPGVDAAVFRPLTHDEPRAARPYVLAVGRFSDPRKNLPMLLRAYARLATAGAAPPDLVVAGPEHPAALWAMAADLGVRDRVAHRLQPSTAELAVLFRQAICLALPSDEEGFGMVVVEAMASGTPVVATRCGGPDGIITDGVDGFLVDRDDEEAMAERLGRLSTDADLAQSMGQAARATVEARYEDRVAGALYLGVYDSLLGSTPFGATG